MSKFLKKIEFENEEIIFNDNSSEISALKGSVSALTDSVEELQGKVDESVTESEFNTYTANTESILNDKADKSEIPTLDGYATEQWVEDKGYLTEHQDLSDYALKSDIPTDYVDNSTYNTYTAETAQKIAEIEEKGYDDTEVRELISGNTSEINALKGSVTALTDSVEELQGKVDESVTESEFNTYTANTESILNDKADKSEIPTLDGYATEQWVEDKGYSTFSGSYNDLTDKPTIPDPYDDSELRNKIRDIEETIGYIDRILESI